MGSVTELISEHFCLDELAAMFPEEDNEDRQAANEDHQIPAINGAQQEWGEADFYWLVLHNNYRVDENVMSQYLYNMPGKLSRSEPRDLGNLSVFWARTLSPIPRVDESEDIKEMMKTALQSYRFDSSGAVLAQFWAPDKDGDQVLLSTSDLPFGVCEVQAWLCRYRKRYMHHKYITSDWDNGNENCCGPPGRVFGRGVPEIRVCVESYSIQDYPLRNDAISCGAKCYAALPVFESSGRQRCVGVLEVVSFLPKVPWLGLTLIDSFSKIIYSFGRALEDAGLRSSDIFSINDLQYFEPIKREANELQKVLKVVCEAHNLPYSQIWGPGGVTHNGATLLFSLNISHRQSDKYLPLLNVCQKSHWRSEEGVVGKAYSSGNAWFCEDITQSSLNQCSPAVAAREVNLASSLAIGFRWSGCKFVAEFFLSNTKRTRGQLWTIMSSLLSTTRHHFGSGFEVFPDERTPKELFVEVVRFSNGCKLYQFTEPPLGGRCSEDDEPNTQPGVEVTANGGDSINLERITAASPGVEEIPPSGAGGMQLRPPPSPQSLSFDVNAVEDGEKNDCGPEQTDTVVIPLDEDEEVAETFNCGHKITKEHLEQHFGKKLEDAAKSLGVSRSTFKRSCRQNNILRWPSSKRKKLNTSLSMTSNAKRRIAENCGRGEPHAVSTPDKGTASDANPMPQATTLQSGSSMIIKAKYRTDMIKFKLSFSATLTELMHEVAKRFELQADTLKAKYQDKDKEWLLLTCDDDLHESMMSMTSVGQDTVYILIEPKM